jgi:hypothetical protein
MRSGVLWSQVFNVEQQRIRTDTTGWSGNARMGFDLVESESKVFQANAKLHVQRKWKKDLVLLLGEYGMMRASGSDYLNNGFGHLRYNRKLARFTIEAFVQGQYNKVLRLRFRGLAGAGPRFKLLQTGRFRLYAALLGMFEREIEDEDGWTHNDWRMSDYVSWTWNPNGTASVTHTTYLQPAAWNVGDCRVASQTDASFQIISGLSAGLSLQYAFDSRPPRGAVKTSYAVRQVLSYDFGR